MTDLCECGHEWGVHLIDTSLRHVCVPDCLCTAYRPASASTDTERSPDGLVERVERAEGSLLGSEWTTEGRARSAAAAIADWLEECDPQRMTAYGAAADRIRREVEGADRA